AVAAKQRVVRGGQDKPRHRRRTVGAGRPWWSPEARCRDEKETTQQAWAGPGGKHRACLDHAETFATGAGLITTAPHAVSYRSLCHRCGRALWLLPSP